MRLARGLAVGLTISLSAVVAPVSGSIGPTRTALAAGCTPLAQPSSGSDYSFGGTFPEFDTWPHIAAYFDAARTAEGCTVPIEYRAIGNPHGITQAMWDGLNGNQEAQMYLLYNHERTDRGLGPLQLDRTLLSQVDRNHSKEMGQYSYFAHQSPINNPPSDVFSRTYNNPVTTGKVSASGENIACGFAYFALNSSGTAYVKHPSAAYATFGYLYQDAGSAWGHRRGILGYYTTNNGTTDHFGQFNWVGIGFADVPGSPYEYYWSSDFLQDRAPTAAYVPPGTADSTAPTLAAPVSVSATTVQVAAVADSGSISGSTNGLRGVTFYYDAPFDSTMTWTGVQGTQVAGTTSWTATLARPSSTSVLHAVAYDGSGNYTDCAATATVCGASAPTAARIASFSVHRAGGLATVRWHLASLSGVGSFDLYAGAHRLTGQSIRRTQSHSYSATVAWAGKDRLTLRLHLTGGGEFVVAVR